MGGRKRVCKIYDYSLQENLLICNGCGKVIGMKSHRGLEIVGHERAVYKRVIVKGKGESKNEDMS